MRRLKHEARHTGDSEQVWKSFLAGSLIGSSLIYFFLTENVMTFFSALGLVAVGVVLFLDTNMSLGRHAYITHNIFFSLIGFAVSVFCYLTKILPFYLFVLVVLIIVTWFHKWFRKLRVIRS